MDTTVLNTILTALVAGAAAKAQDVASTAVVDAYAGLKALIIKRLGKQGAVQSVEDEPDSEKAREVLAEALAKLQTETESIQEQARHLERALSEAKTAQPAGAADIDVEQVRGRVNATVSNLVASGRIKLGSVIAETGDATVEGLYAGGTEKN